MKTHPGDDEGEAGTVYVLHFEPAYYHARHYVGWSQDVAARVAEHLAGVGSPLVRAAVAAGVRVYLAATMPGSRRLERRLKRWHKTGQFCPRCRAARAGASAPNAGVSYTAGRCAVAGVGAAGERRDEEVIDLSGIQEESGCTAPIPTSMR